MPTKTRKEREREKQREREQLSSPPEHIKVRIDARLVSKQKNPFSEVLKSFHDDPARTRLGEGLVEADEYGDLWVRSDLMSRKADNAANAVRRDTREQNVVMLKKRYQSIWGKPGQASGIAASEGLSVRTVQKYFRDFP